MFDDLFETPDANGNDGGLSPRFCASHLELKFVLL